MLLTAGLAAAQSPAESGTSAGQDWKTIIYPVHAWLPVFGADVTLPGQSTPPGSGGGSGGGSRITTPSAKTSGNFNGAALAGFRVERARLSIEGEFLWAGMTGSVEAPHFNLSLDTFAYRVMGGFRIAPALYIDGGVRRFAVKMTASILDFQPVTWKPGMWEAVIGATFRPDEQDLRPPGRRRFQPATIQAEAARRSHRGWSPLSHLSVGEGGLDVSHGRTARSRLKRHARSQTLNSPVLTLGSRSDSLRTSCRWLSVPDAIGLDGRPGGATAVTTATLERSERMERSSTHKSADGNTLEEKEDIPALPSPRMWFSQPSARARLLRCKANKGTKVTRSLQ